MTQQIDIVANLLMKVDNAEAGIKKLQNSLSKLKMPEGLENSFKKSFANLDTIFARYRSQVEKGFNTKADVTAFNKTSKALDIELTRISKHFTELTGKQIDFKINNSNLINTERQLEKLIHQKEQLTKQSLELKVDGSKLNNVKAVLESLQKTTGNTKAGQAAGNALFSLSKGDLQSTITYLQQAEVSCKKLGQAKQEAFSGQTGLSMTNALQTILNLLTSTEGEFAKADAQIDAVREDLSQIRGDQLREAEQYAVQLAESFTKDEAAIRQANGAMQEYARSSQSMSQQLGDLQQSTQYFFSLRNMINLLKRGIDDAVQSVKELDKAMTETAVVTDFSVADMWKDLPKYTKIANELGATTQGAYETMTLYYQQGLEQQQAFALGAETMKMARIAGLDYAETTDMMTAALRGFNMELNEVSAKRVNDVYSELAAITASDTEELGTAMQRTASIAHSAGASFEGTTAFLAQAIETTREPAENIGTAMKTIIARFQEMKKNPLEISEVDGEEVNFNKIDAALKTIGVDLVDANGQFREFDQVMLDISAKWDTLTQSQQRYIATTAAGSRQQSRFIAMVSNYDRTMQLMEAANNSAGASDEQFGKTMESLESKLNKLHNAWQLFTMGIADNVLIKGTVDGLTTLIGKVNDLLDTLGGGQPLLKSFLSLFTAFTGLKVGGKLINSLIGGLGGLIDPTSSFGKGFKGGFFNQERNSAQAISTPIVQAIHQLQAALTNKPVSRNQAINNSANWQSFKDANVGLRSLLKETGAGELSLSGVYGKIAKLDDKQQSAILNQLPGLQFNLQKNGIKFEKKDVSQASQKLLDTFNNEINTGLKNKTLDTQTALKIFGTPQDFKTAMAAKGDDYAKAAEEVLYGQGNSRENALNKLINEARTVDALYNRERSDDYYKEIAEKRLAEEEKENFDNFAKSAQTKGGQIANSIGNIGTAAMYAGQGIAQLGMQLSNAGFDKAGAAVTDLGYRISSLGQIATSTGSLIGKITDSGGLLNILKAHPMLTAVAAGIATVTTLIVALNKRTESIKKKGEEVVKTYSDASKELKDSISQVQSYQSELSQLSTGVDKNGLNVSLDTTEYERYKEIVNDLVKQNPKIVEGWNSEGQAIINVNKALKETIALKQKNLKKKTQDYLSDISGQQLINARNVNKGYVDTRNRSPFVADQSNFLRQAQRTADAISNSGVADAATAAGFNLEKIKEGDIQAVRFLQEHYSLLESVYKQGGEKISSDLSKQIGDLSDGLKAYDEAVTPLVDYLTEYATNQKLFANLPVELTDAFNEGIKSIAGKNLSVNEMKGLTNYLSLELKNAFDEAEPLLQEADKALDTFAQDLSETAYNKKAGEIGDQLRGMAKEAEALGHVEVANWYENQASRIENAITDASTSIAENIDTLSDNITNAKNNFDALSESINDYYTLADQAHGLVETALEDKNTEGNGSKTFWNTYRGLASEEAYNEHDINKAIANMEQFQKYFTEGAEGSRAFAQKMIDWQNKEFQFTDANGKKTTKQLKDFFELAADGTMRVTDAFTNLSDEQYAQLASVFDLSADGFTAILNKLRQFGDLDFTDFKGVRKALALDERSVKTKAPVKTAEEKDTKRLYYGQSILDAETADLKPETKEALVENLRVNGSIQLPTGAENLLKAPAEEGGKEGSLLAQFVEDTKGTGNQVENVMKALTQSGEYRKDDLEKIHTALIKDGGLLAGAKDANKSFEELYPNLEANLIDDPVGKETNNYLSDIESSVNTIAGIVAAGKVKEGYLPDTAKQSDNLLKDLIGKEGVVDSWAQQFARGKDENGNLITNDKDYAERVNKLTEAQTANNNYIKELKEGKQAAIDRGASQNEINTFDAEIKAATDNAALIKTYLKNGADAYLTTIQQAQTISDYAVLQLNSLKNLPLEQKQEETANVLTGVAEKLQNLNWSPEQIQGYFKDNFGIELELKGGEFATDVGRQIQEQLNNLGETKIDAILNISSINVTGGAAAKGRNNTPSAIRRVGTMARGSKKGYIINGEPTLTGELGPELVWEPRQNSAYMVGENGPQFANISKNAVVWNAQQTKKIKKNSKSASPLGTGARGIHSFGTMAGGNTSGGGNLNIPGTFEIDANANIQDVIPPTIKPEIPVKAKLETENGSDGILSKLFGGNKGPSIDVAANITSVNTNEQLQSIQVIGNIIKLNNEATTDEVEATATVTQVVKGNQIAGEPISIKAVATTTKVENKTPAPTPKVSTGNQSMKVTADTSAAQAKINQLINLFNKTYTLKYKASGPSSIKVPISANFTGSWKKTVEITRSGAKGINNHITFHSTPSFGSVAKGRYGTVGPNNKGGLTLTGERGFEIAWLPSENRSMILGANGPQMLDLPKDAVVFTNEQSKKILSQKAIPAGSHSVSASGKNILGAIENVVRSGGSNTSSSKKSSKSSKSAKKEKSKEKKKKETPKIVNFSIEETIRFNIDARLEKLGYEIDKRTKSIEKTLGRVGTTSKSIKGVVQDQLSALQQQKQANSELLASYQRQSNEIFNWQEQFSYQAYQKTTTGKGKKKKTTNELTTLTGVYNLRDFMMQQADGSYTINEGMIAAIGNMEIEKQVHDSVSNAVSSINSGMIKAKQAMDEVDEKIEDLQNKLYETFNRWKKSIDTIYLISQKLETVNKRREIRESQYDVALLQLKTGFDEAGESLNRMIEVTSKSMNELAQSITGNYALISEKYKKYNEAIQLSNYNEHQDSTDAQDKYAAAQIALRLYQQYGGDMDKAINGIKQEIAKYDDKGYGVPTDEAVKEILDTIHERRMDLFDSINEVLSEISDAFEKFVEYQETVKSFEDELLDGLEKETEDQIDALSKLNDSLTKALKNLLDEVKRKLDERRRVEDNAKTELDITRKQQRLAALRANTSGGNQVEIAQLEKEIADSQQSYQRTLEDQLLDKLQQQADRAEQQRERQIQLLEILKDVESSTNKAEVEKWLNDPEKFKNEIYEAWKAANDYDKATTRGKELLDSQFKSDFAEVVVALGQLESLDDISNEIDTIIDVLLHSQSLDLSEDFMAAFLEDLSAVEKNLENAKRFKGLNFGANDLRNAGWDLDTLAQAGYGIGDLKEANFSAAQLKALKDENGNNRYSLANLASYYSAKDLKNANYSIGELKNYFSAKDLKNAGFNEYDFGSAQISYANAKSVFGRDALAKVEYYKTSVQNEKDAELKAKQDAYKSALANLHDVGDKDQLLKVIQAGKSLGKDLNTIYDDIRKGHYHIKAKLLSSLYRDTTYIPGVGSHNYINSYKYADALSSSGYSRPELEEFLRHMALYAGMHFATGGLANFTGPAWLDGTPSKPELVLNAQDTKNFIALKDVLSHAMGTTKNIDTSYSGDNIYEININVDKIEKDYDVDRVAERVKKIIVKDSSYRNVTQVRNFR